ncbi:MAG: winged helix-turn-helix domain-containing protein, partial [Propionibacteriaceae bacterium]|nr:winged helix-turn-helix domain-containing protein [Propionibacteriaceae bacterium]
STGSTVEVTFPYNPVWMEAQGRAASPFSDVSVPLGTESGTENGTDDRVRILDILRKHPETTYDDLTVELAMPRRTLARYIKALREAGVLVRVGSARSGYWEVLSD